MLQLIARAVQLLLPLLCDAVAAATAAAAVVCSSSASSSSASIACKATGPH
jgi:hypothetical protein